MCYSLSLTNSLSHTIPSSTAAMLLRMPRRSTNSSLLLLLLVFFRSFVGSQVVAEGRPKVGGRIPLYSGKKGPGDRRVAGVVEHEHSVGIVVGGAYYGTRATFNLWNPYVEYYNEFSLAQLWLLWDPPQQHDTSNTTFDEAFCSLEVGWQVSPEYGDNHTRLFVYWTGDGYRTTGCYNLNCTGFIQTSKKIIPGKTALSPVSIIDGSQYEITLHVFKEPATGDWLLYLDDEQVGYWPQNLSYLTTNHANRVDWGGEIINREINGQHTTTQMGSGNFAKSGLGKAAYVRNLQVADAQNNLQNVDIKDMYVIASNVTCYNISASNDNTWGTHFFFGGPGQNSNCP